ncbi:hypothetical protein [Microcoleus sp. N9_A1]|uniref:hypothetical protein n=1 Tax=Microcoleus sp. N9_A1 TaxID=3055380 RepID=UPI002FD69AFF
MVDWPANVICVKGLLAIMQYLRLEYFNSRSPDLRLKFICGGLLRQVAKIVMLPGSIADCTASFPT